MIGNYFYIFLGMLSLGLGGLGIFVPGLPTTPLVLLAAYFFSKSSPRLHNWLLSNKYFGHYIKEYHENPAIPLKVKIVALTIMWSMVLLASLKLIDFVPAKVIVLLLGIIGTWYVGFYIPNKK